MQFITKLILSIFVVVSIVTASEFLLVPEYGFNAISWHDKIIRIGIVSAGTLVGIAFQVILKRLVDGKTDQISIKGELGLVLNSRDFWIAIFLSPTVMAAAYKLVSGIDSLLLVLYMSFQNGFFFRELARQMKIGSRK